MLIPTNLMVSISGIRGTVPDVLTPEVAYAFAWAYAATLPEGAVVVSRDSRASGHDLKKAVIQALADQGRQVLDADLIPLPTTQLAVEKTGAAGAIDVTASHNPLPYNGLKFLNNKGIFIDQAGLDALLAVLADFDETAPRTANEIQVEDIQEKAMAWHVDELKDRILPGERLVVAVDAVNGAGSLIVPQLLSQIGCDTLPIAVDPTQPFPHTPEPLPANLVWTQDQLKGKQFDLCLVVDPDADRLVLIDEQGRLIAEEATIPLVAQELLLQGRRGNIVVNMSTSRMTEDVAAQFESRVERSKVGEVNVVIRMQEIEAIYGGEGGGGVIDPQVHYGRDSLVGLIYVVSLMRRTGKKLSQLVDELPHYEMRKTKVPVPTGVELSTIYDNLQARFPEATANRLDGLRLDWPTKWVHLRPSNTEPIFRIISEAPTAEEADELTSLDILA